MHGDGYCSPHQGRIFVSTGEDVMRLFTDLDAPYAITHRELAELTDYMMKVCASLSCEFKRGG